MKNRLKLLASLVLVFLTFFVMPENVIGMDQDDNEPNKRSHSLTFGEGEQNRNTRMKLHNSCSVSEPPFIGEKEQQDDIIEHIYDNSITYSFGNFSYKNDPPTLLTNAQKPQEAKTQCTLIYSMEPEEFEEEKVLRKVIAGQDGRKRILDTAEWPYSIHSQLSITFGDKICGGSGSLIGPHHLLTCGHNLYDHKIEKWADEILVYPALNSKDAPFGEAKVTKAYTFKNWVNQKDKRFDIALLILDSSIGKYTGWGGISSVDDSTLSKKKVHITGYPGDKNLNEMWSMCHKIKSFEIEEFQYEIDTYPGQSGSAVWNDHDDGPIIFGVHTLGIDTINSGVRISSQKFTNFFVRLISENYELKKFLQLPFEEWQKQLQSIGEPWAKILLKEVSSYNITQLKLSYINAHGTKFLANSNFNALTRLECCGEIGPVGATSLANSSISTLTSLKLTSCKIGDVGAKHLSNGNLNGLTELELWSSGIGDVGAEHLSNGNFYALTCLVLGFGDISDIGMESIANGKLSGLTSLNLYGNNIGPDGIKFLANGNLSNLIILNLEANNIGTEGAEYLSNGNLTSLVKLNLKKNNIGNDGATAILKGNLAVLREVELWNNHITQNYKATLVKINPLIKLKFT
jgi:V8-like Glu-specific endopeptidase